MTAPGFAGQPLSASSLSDGLPDIADGIHARLCDLQRLQTPEFAERVCIELEGIRRHVLRYRESLIAEGRGNGQ